jgi:3-hydroxypropanoate dehydrogenase
MPIRPDIRDRYANDENLAEEVAFRNSSLQGAYFLIAICALSLDTGPLSGFDRAMVDQKFFPAGRIRSNFLLCIGNGRTSEFFSRLPRLGFDEICSFA